MNAPLAERMRPKSFDEYIGQEHVIGKSAALRSLIDQAIVPSLIFWGPPGVGKTTLAELIASHSGRKFFALSAINSGVKEVREVLDKAKNQSLFNQGKQPILFIDEIHRFSKSQQDSLLGAVERGIITLIGATTENPSFEVIPALLSRCQVYTLSSLGINELDLLLQRALDHDEWLLSQNLTIKEKDALFLFSGGDGRKLLNNLELIVGNIGKNGVLLNKTVEENLQSKSARYDKSGEQHYDIISAFIKSVRGSDPNAAVYWLARMIEGGEKPEFIARRLLILAAEDIGLANPNALLLANSSFEAVQKIGWPEGRIILSECTIYLANSPKSNSAYKAINQAQQLVKQSGDLEVPLHLRNAPTKLMKDLGYGDNYKYSHDFENNFVNQEYMPKEISGRTLYVSGENPAEKKASETLQKRWPKYFEK